MTNKKDPSVSTWIADHVTSSKFMCTSFSNGVNEALTNPTAIMAPGHTEPLWATLFNRTVAIFSAQLQALICSLIHTQALAIAIVVLATVVLLWPLFATRLIKRTVGWITGVGMASVTIILAVMRLVFPRPRRPSPAPNSTGPTNSSPDTITSKPKPLNPSAQQPPSQALPSSSDRLPPNSTSPRPRSPYRLPRHSDLGPLHTTPPYPHHITLLGLAFFALILPALAGYVTLTLAPSHSVVVASIVITILVLLYGLGFFCNASGLRWLGTVVLREISVWWNAHVSRDAFNQAGSSDPNRPVPRPGRDIYDWRTSTLDDYWTRRAEDRYMSDADVMLRARREREQDREERMRRQRRWEKLFGCEEL